MDFYKRPLGVIPSKADPRDYRIQEFVEEEEIPEEYLVPPYKSEADIPIYDQNGFGMCVGFSGALLKEQQEYLETGKPVRMAPGFIYGNRETGMYMGEGMEPRDAWTMLCKDGVPPFADFPVLGDFPTCYGEVLKNKEKLKTKAMNNRTLSYVRLYSTQDMQLALMKTGFINIDIAVYKPFYEVGKDGILSSTTGSIYGYHALTCAGWKKINGKSYWIIINSWGKEWGKNGICYMPFEYKGIQEAWAITDLQRKVIEGNTEAKIIPPGHFMIPFRGLFEAENAEEIKWWRNEKGKIEAEAILPPAKRRKVHVIEGNKDIEVEILE
jgi:hypothetical protein